MPAGAPHRIVPTETSIMMRYKQMHAGLEGVAWYCDRCDAEVYREVWDTATALSQLKYDEVSSRFAADASLSDVPPLRISTPRHLIWQTFVGPKWHTRSEPIWPLVET